MALIRLFSILAIVFGVIIILQPAILAYLVAAFFILLGLSGLGVSSGRNRSYIKIFRG